MVAGGIARDRRRHAAAQAVKARRRPQAASTPATPAGAGLDGEHGVPPCRSQQASPPCLHRLRFSTRRSEAGGVWKVHPRPAVYPGRFHPTRSAPDAKTGPCSGKNCGSCSPQVPPNAGGIVMKRRRSSCTGERHCPSACAPGVYEPIARARSGNHGLTVRGGIQMKGNTGAMHWLGRFAPHTAKARHGRQHLPLTASRLFKTPSTKRINTRLSPIRITV